VSGDIIEIGKEIEEEHRKKLSKRVIKEGLRRPV
jgi:hypothetical protein